MPSLINRNPPGRLSCVHAFLRSLLYRFGTQAFTGVEAKHKVEGSHNPIEYCTCSREYMQQTALVIGDRKYCPFLRAGSSKSYCYLVNSDLLDTQKSKAVGAAIQALEALGLCKRTLNSLKRLRYASLTDAGMDIASRGFFEPKTRAYYQSELLNYGPMIGLLHLLDTAQKFEIKHSEISKHMGRPNNYDKVTLSTGDDVTLNDGDTRDPRTRTTGALQAWLTYAGYIRPQFQEFSDPFSETDEYYCSQKNKLGYSKIFVDRDKINRFFESKPFIKRPLSYDFYIKGIGTAREYSQRSLSGRQLENLALKEFGQKVKDRRLLLMYSYSVASNRNRGLNVERLAELSNFKGSPFVVDQSTHEKVLVDKEVNFLTIAGAPFLRSKEDYRIIYPRVKIDNDKLKNENPFLSSRIDKIVSEKEILV
jgi:hypothetical protein